MRPEWKEEAGLGCNWTRTAAAQHLGPLASVGAVPGRRVTDHGGPRGAAAEDTLTGTSSAGHTALQSQAPLVPRQTPRVCVWHTDLVSGSVILMNRREHTHTHAHTHGCMPTGILTCIHTLIHTLTQTCTHKRMSMPTHTHKLTHVFMCTSGHTCAFTYTHMISQTHAPRMQLNTHLFTGTRTHPLTHACTHTQSHVPMNTHHSEVSSPTHLPVVSPAILASGLSRGGVCDGHGPWEERQHPHGARRDGVGVPVSSCSLPEHPLASTEGPSSPGWA